MPVIDHVMTRRGVISLLRKHDVPIHRWGRDHSSNSLEDLMDSIRKGEVHLTLRPKGDEIPSADGRPLSLVLNVHVAVPTIYCFREGRWYVLREKGFRFKNGRWKKRKAFDGSLGEKIRAALKESPIEGARRGLAEELGGKNKEPGNGSIYHPGFSSPMNYTIAVDRFEHFGPRPSDWYPGLLDLYHRHHFRVTIGANLHLPKYVAIDNGREVHFIWEEWKPTRLWREV